MASGSKQKLEAMRYRFIEQLPERWANIETAWSDIIGGRGNNADIQALHKGLHTLIGTSGTLGLTTFSRELRRTEQKLIPYLCEDQLPKALASELQADLERLTQGIRALCNSHEESCGEEDDKNDAETVPAPEPPGQSQSAAEHLIYWLDPDSLSMQPLADGLGEYGYQVAHFDDWKTYQSSIKKQWPNVAVFELLNPDPGEDAILEHVRALADEDVPVLVVSSDASFERRLKVARTGADYFPTKPLSLERLVARIDSMAHSPAGRASRTLIVDDQLSVGAYYKALLESIGVRAKIQTDPFMILEHVEQLEPDLIILDIQMPEITGMDLARIIRQDEKHQLTPILFLSARETPSYSPELLALGAHDLLQKGLDDRSFLKQVKARLRRSRLSTEWTKGAQHLRRLMSDDELHSGVTASKPRR